MNLNSYKLIILREDHIICVWACMCVYKAFYSPVSLNKLEVMQMHDIRIKQIYYQRHSFLPTVYTNMFWSEQLCKFMEWNYCIKWFSHQNTNFCYHNINMKSITNYPSKAICNGNVIEVIRQGN